MLIKKAFWSSLWLILFTLGQSLSAKGLTVSPMEQFVRPGQSVIYFASNRGDDPIAVEVLAEAWTISEDGEEILTPTTELLAYPSQFVLKGHTSKRIKVGYKNRQKIDVEKCFRVTIRELPIDLNPKQTGERFKIYRASGYRTSFYLKPKKSTADIEIESVSLEDKKLTLRLHNPGTVHVHLIYPHITLYSDSGEAYELTDQKILNAMAGKNMHAGISRNFTLDLS